MSLDRVSEIDFDQMTMTILTAEFFVHFRFHYVKNGLVSRINKAFEGLNYSRNTNLISKFQFLPTSYTLRVYLAGSVLVIWVYVTYTHTYLPTPYNDCPKTPIGQGSNDLY